MVGYHLDWMVVNLEWKARGWDVTMANPWQGKPAFVLVYRDNTGYLRVSSASE